MRPFFILILLLCTWCAFAQTPKISTISADGWANNSINTVIFRKNSLVSFKGWQYAAFYNSEQYVVLSKRAIGASKWEVSRTDLKGDANDAHKSISIMVDGAGYLHLTWGQHNNPLNYAVSKQPGSLQMGARSMMTGSKEGKVSYPEFYGLANGDLLFMYRDGSSGNGDLIMDSYSINTRKWQRLQDNLINGEGKRNAYWQMAVDKMGAIHLSWVWRETPDVASNHDIAYACSKDGGKTWQRSNGQPYALPITAATAEYACRIPQGSELINQTSMVADADGHPYIATYWREEGSRIPQYHLVYHDGQQWISKDLGFRKTSFTLSGSGTKSIPVSRPQIIAWKNGKLTAAALIFRDAEQQDRVSIAVSRDLRGNDWKIRSLSDQQVGSWEPTYDTELWKTNGILNLFVQKVTQIDGEGVAKAQPQPVQVWEWKP